MEDTFLSKKNRSVVSVTDSAQKISDEFNFVPVKVGQDLSLKKDQLDTSWKILRYLRVNRFFWINTYMSIIRSNPILRFFNLKTILTIVFLNITE